MVPGQINPNQARLRQTLPYGAAASSANRSTAGATNQAATVVLNADAARPQFISQLIWSYQVAPAAAAALTITASDAGVVFGVDVVAAGPGQLTFNPPLEIPAGQTATIAAGSANTNGSTAKLNVVAWKIE